MMTEISVAATILIGMLAWVAAVFLGVYTGDETAVTIAVIGIGMSYLVQGMDAAVGLGGVWLKPILIPTWGLTVVLWIVSVLFSIF